MSRAAARITQAEIQRIIRAAKKEGAPYVDVKIGDEAMARIPLTSGDKPVAEPKDIIL